MKLKNFTGTLIMLSVLIPNLVSAATISNGTTSCSNSTIDQGLGNLFNYASCLITVNVMPLLMTIAVAGFVWGVIQMYINPDNEEARKKGKMYAVWGLFGLFVIVALWGLVGVFSETFGIQQLLPQLSQELK